MAEDSGISWTHNTQNFWVGCDKIAPECSKCYIGRVLSKQGRDAWGKLYRTQTWEQPWKWEQDGIRSGQAKRVFTCSLSDFFHAKAAHGVIPLDHASFGGIVGFLRAVPNLATVERQQQ
jgi:protein gp37